MIDLLRTRRSIRKYRKEAIDAPSLDILKEALLRSPSSRGRNPCTFIFVDDAELLAALSIAKEQGASFLKDAALGIVICGDETRSDVWVEDCSITSIVAHVTAHSLGLGSCWIQIRNRLHSDGGSAEAYIQGLLSIPPQLKVESIIAIGHPDEVKTPVPAGQLDCGKVKHNRY